jgi:SAM-dependent methyltransferase
LNRPMNLIGGRRDSPFWPAGWSANAFTVVDRMRKVYYASADRPMPRYPVRFLRYWYMRHLLEAHAARLGRPIAVLEIGVDRGQQLTFMDAPGDGGLPPVASRWDAVDLHADATALRSLGYSDYIHMDLENDGPPPLKRSYDAMIFLHVLEHLHAPESCLKAFLPFLAADGVLIGGAPTMPKLIADLGYEKRLARKAKRNGHVSVLSPERIELFAESEGLRLSFLSGAFFMRNTGSAIENSRLWLRMNLAFGAMFPSLAGEVYFALQR